jgi:hypothetical protein
VNEREQKQYIESIEMAFVIRREIDGLRIGVKTALADMSTQKDGWHAAILRSTLAHLESASWSLGSIIVSIEAALSAHALLQKKDLDCEDRCYEID